MPRTFGALHRPLLILNANQSFELLTGRHLFYQKAANYSHELHLQYIEEYLGSFPLGFLRACEDRDKYFDEKGERTRLISRE